MIKFFYTQKSLLIKVMVILSFSFSFSFAMSSTSDEQAERSARVQSEVVDSLRSSNLSELQENLSNRLILGLFGKDALVYALPIDTPDNIISEINGLSMEEVQEYSKPFNTGNLSGFLMILSSFFFVAFSVLAIYFAWVVSEGLFNTQESGEFFGKQTSTLFSVLKGASAIILIIPAYGFSHHPFSDFQNSVDGTQYGSFSISQVFIIKAMGLSNDYSNYIWASFVTNYEKAFPTIVLPNTYSKENEMKDILNYVMCVKSYNTGETSNISFQKSDSEKGTYRLNASFKDCSLSGNIKYNDSIINELKKDTEISNLINSVVDYESLFNKTLNSSLLTVFNSASKYSDLLLNEISSLTLSTEKSGVLVSPSTWRNMCANPEDMFKKGEINNVDLPIIQYYMEKCLSENFVLSFISSDVAKAKAKYETDILAGYNVDLCDSPSAYDNGERTFVKDELILNGGKSKTLSQCLKESCGSDGGLYQCTSAIEFVKTNSESRRMIRQGWLTAGAYSYVLFSGFSNNIAQELISSLRTSFTLVSGKESTKYTSGDFLFPIISINANDKNAFKNFESMQDILMSSSKIMDIKSQTIALLKPSSGMAGANNPDGLFGITKFVTCSKSPMSITDGFSCGNITEELHSFGAKMVAVAIEIKTAATAAQLFGFAKQRRSSSMSGGIASSVPRMASFLSSSVDYYVPFLKVVGLASVSGVIKSTSFSTIDSYWFQNPETYISLIALMSGQVPFIEGFMNFIFGLLLFMGLVFGFILPLLPYFLWLIVISGWATMILGSFLIAPVWAASLINPSNDHTSSTAKKGFLILLTIIMRSPFMVIGLILAWLLSNTLIGPLVGVANISEALLLSDTASISGFIDTIIKLIVYLSLVYFIYNLVFSIIEGFYEIGSNWLFSSSLSSFSSKDRSENWKGKFSSVKSFIGVK